VTIKKTSLGMILPVAKRKIQTQTKVFCITRVWVFSSSTQFAFRKRPLSIAVISLQKSGQRNH